MMNLSSIKYSSKLFDTDLKRFSVPDINELNLPKTCEINFPDDDDLLNFRLIIYPDEVCVCGILQVRPGAAPV